MSLRWTARSQRHLAALHAYIAEQDPAAADRVAIRIVELVESLLREHPLSGRPGRVVGTRELVVTGTPYIVAYEEVAGVVTILAVLHGSRRWPERF